MPGTDLTVDVVEALAKADRIAPAELGYPLSESVDPEVLEKLSDSEESTWELTLRVSDHHVTITSGGDVVINGVNYAVDPARHE